MRSGMHIANHSKTLLAHVNHPDGSFMGKTVQYTELQYSGTVQDNRRDHWCANNWFGPVSGGNGHTPNSRVVLKLKISSHLPWNWKSL